MNNMQQQTPDNKPDVNQSISKRVLEMIDEQGVEPCARYVFLCKSYTVWILWGLSIVIGAVSVAIVWFATTYRYYDIYEAMYDNFYTFMLNVLPFAWIGIFFATISVASWQLRNTSRGYRFSTTVLAVSSLTLSVAVGALLHIGGFGWSIDTWLGNNAPMYQSQLKLEYSMWQNPADGRLIGRQVAVSEQASSTIVFEDSKNTQWLVYTVDLPEEDVLYLAKGNKVRLLGSEVDTAEQVTFHACGVFPWLLDQSEEMSDLTQGREHFIDVIYNYHDGAESRRIAIEELVAADIDGVAPGSPCHDLKAVARLHAEMQKTN